KGTAQTMAPESRQLSAFVAVRDRMCRGYNTKSHKVDYGTRERISDALLLTTNRLSAMVSRIYR
ncbi:hypothetical protein, partial [Rhizobium sp. S9]|uniref:hypothetical protein n=1 Tax=Rhizobium sp. S9 TaxID=2035454 RepID=UPI001AEF761C